MIRRLPIGVFALFLVSLWIYQLPVSPVERALATVFDPVQKIMQTDRVYRMYAPDPRPAKEIPYLELRSERSPVRFLKAPPNPSGSFGPLAPFAREKWANFVDHLALSYRIGGFLYSEERGAAVFARLAERICRVLSRGGDRVETVKLGVRRVFYGDFRGDIVWDPPEILEVHPCR